MTVPTDPAGLREQLAEVCGHRLVDWTCALPPGPHPDWRHVGDGAWWTQTRCPADCGQPNTPHDCTKET